MAPGVPPSLETFHVQVDDGRCIEGQELAENKSSDDGHSEGLARFGSISPADNQGNSSEDSGHGGHENGTDTQHTCCVSVPFS